MTSGAKVDADRVLRSNKIRASNAQVVLDALREMGASTRAELAESTSLSRQALGPILRNLVEDGLVEQSMDLTARRGRPAAMYTVATRGSLTALLMLGTTDSEILVSDALGDFIASASMPSRWGTSAKAVAEGAVVELDSLLAQHQMERSRLSRVTLCVEGLVNEEEHVVHQTSAWEDEEVTIDDLLSGLLPKQTDVDASSNSHYLARAAMAEARIEPTELVMVLQIGTEAWLHVAQHGNILAGHSGRSGYINHQPIEGNDRSCPCGRIGCFATVIGNRGVDLDLTDTTPEYGDDEESIRWLSRGIAPMMQIIDPDRLILNGPWIDDHQHRTELKNIARDQLGLKPNGPTLHLATPLLLV